MEKLAKPFLYFVQTPTLLSIILGVLLLILQAIQGSLDPSVQIIFFLFFLFLTGIPHGALDHLVERRTAQKQQKTYSFSVFLSKYVATMVIYGLLWYTSPTVSLLFFLFISAWHFGETDLENVPSTVSWSITRFLLGGLILSVLLLTHAEEVAPIWRRIVQNNEFALSIWQFSADYAPVLLSLWATFFIGFFALSYRQSVVYFDKMRLLRLVCILVLTCFLPLLPAFALYFGGWHALNSFHSIQKYLIQDEPITVKSALVIWLKALPFTFLALVFSSFSVWYWQRFLQSWDFIPLLFIFLSLITLPHLNVMHSVNQRNYT